MAPHPHLSTARLSAASPSLWYSEKEMAEDFQMARHHVNTDSHQRVFLLCGFFLVSLEPTKPCTIINCHTRAFRKTHLAITSKLAFSPPNSFNYSRKWHGICLGFFVVTNSQCHRYGGNRTHVNYETSRSHPVMFGFFKTNTRANSPLARLGRQLVHLTGPPCRRNQ